MRLLAPLRTTALLCLALGVGTAQAADTQQQAERLAALRAEVEALSSQLQADKDDARGRLRAIEAQKVELEVQVRRQELRLERLVAEESEERAAIAAEGTASPALREAVRAGLDRIEAEVAASIPFQREQRLAALDALRGKLAADTLTPEQAAARLWAFAEDERRLTRENALSRQVITLDGEEVLVDVARVGMVALYWRAPDGSVGQARGGGDAWTWERVDGADADAVEALFDAMEKGIHAGEFTLPGLLEEAP